MIVLVVGGDRVDAGKTTFSTGFISRTGAAGYKPRAGNDYWFDHDDCLSAFEAGRVYGKDATMLATAENRGRQPETLNPVHRLWTPSPDGGTGLLGREDREFILDRVGGPNPAETTYVLNDTAAIPDRVRDALELDTAISVESVEELNSVVEREYTPEFEAVTSDIERQNLAVVESYGDVAMPLASLDPALITAVAVVEPRRARIYHGDRYCRACEVARSSPREGTLEKRVSDVIAYLDPISRVSLPPLSSRERTTPQAVATAYEDAYDSLLEVARKS